LDVPANALAGDAVGLTVLSVCSEQAPDGGAVTQP
jgi:hypothetical protein